ncbi:hypothetical protein [Erythrobacter sp.]|jgi:hypothetical protein|uniref:hypothetical protein n=1 Tax=Erythrobacter sp. TaxID=1042 RepID=UPI002EB95578|nr:hypothetical protein [Erythrobacter sp.]
MDKLSRTHTIKADTAHSELYFAIGGFWTRETMDGFLKELTGAARPFFKAGEPFNALGDLSAFLPQDRETADAIRQSLMLGRQNGLKRFAVVSTSPLVRMQYRRLTDGLDVAFFDDVEGARNWLRRSLAA